MFIRKGLYHELIVTRHVTTVKFYFAFRINIYIAAKVLPVDREIVEKAAAFKAGRGIPYVDSIILATFILAGCKEIHTTDKNHFAGIKNKGLKIIFYDTP